MYQNDVNDCGGIQQSFLLVATFLQVSLSKAVCDSVDLHIFGSPLEVVYNGQGEFKG